MTSKARRLRFMNGTMKRRLNNEHDKASLDPIAESWRLQQ